MTWHIWDHRMGVFHMNAMGLVVWASKMKGSLSVAWSSSLVDWEEDWGIIHHSDQGKHSVAPDIYMLYKLYIYIIYNNNYIYNISAGNCIWTKTTMVSSMFWAKSACLHAPLRRPCASSTSPAVARCRAAGRNASCRLFGSWIGKGGYHL